MSILSSRFFFDRGSGAILRISYLWRHDGVGLLSDLFHSPGYKIVVATWWLLCGTALRKQGKAGLIQDWQEYLSCHPDMNIKWRMTNSECRERTLPVPPKCSLEQPKYTIRIWYCLRTDAHMIHGSTVTYKSVSRSIDLGCRLKTSSIAKNSACLVPFSSQ